MTPERFNWPGAVCPLAPAPEGDFVRFADVEEALSDKTRLAWLLPMLDGYKHDSPDDVVDLANRRTLAIDVEWVKGLRGKALVDAAMAACPG